MIERICFLVNPQGLPIEINGLRRIFPARNKNIGPGTMRTGP